MHHREDAFSKKGAPMLLDFYSASSTKPDGYQDPGQHTVRREQIVTAVSASLAVLVVAAIAVLLGMA